MVVRDFIMVAANRGQELVPLGTLVKAPSPRLANRGDLSDRILRIFEPVVTTHKHGAARGLSDVLTASRQEDAQRYEHCHQPFDPQPNRICFTHYACLCHVMLIGAMLCLFVTRHD